ncbi:MAG: histidine kinase, partial [Rhodocyclales bacterium]|nr:histidine kinase [Rhodocyclales bacterium]
MKPTSALRQAQHVKATFIGPFAIALAFIMGVFAATFYFVETQVRERDLAERSAAVGKLLAQKLDKDTNLMWAVLRAMMGNPAVEAAFRKRDRSALARQGGPLFQTLRVDHRITHLYFTGPDLVNVYRLHSPADFGDEINRSTMLKARDLEEAVRGLELGPLGTLTLRLVVPWKKDGRILGYLEIGEEIEQLIEEVRDSLSVDILVLVEKRFLLPEQWRHGLALMNRQEDWERFRTHAAVAHTTAQLPAALSNRVLEKLLAGRTAGLEDRGRALHLAALPLDDASGRHIGELVVVRDITGLESTFRWSIAAVAVLSLLAAGGVLGVFYFALVRVERDYRRQHDLEHQLLRLNTEHQHILQVEKLSALGTMVGGIAHQLNNPLVGVVNMAQLADREADDPVRTREILADIRRAGEDCHTFMHRMLEFSKVSGFEAKPTPMAPLIEDTVLLFRQTENQRVPVETRLPDEPAVLTIDPILIRHALFNLLVNAAQATVGDGAIVIGLERAANPGTGAPAWTLSVTDHGKGIAPEDMDKIFVPFFTTRSDGTGLGLPVVLHVALLHNGEITATNQPGGGARFAIWLP